MAELLVVQTLTKKRAEILGRIMAYEAQIAQLRNSVVFKVVQALRHAKRHKLARMVEEHKGTCVWAPGEAVTPRVVANSPSTSG